MKLMVLGAGVYQLPLIRRARAMGHEVIVCSRAGPYPGFGEASAVHYIDTTDIAGCVAVARSEGIDGVACPGSDVPLAAVGAIVDTLGLIGPSARAAALATDKRLMKQAFMAAGIPTPRAVMVADLAAATSAAAAIGYPVMLKVADSSGSRGIIKVDRAVDLAESYAACRASTRVGELLVEEYAQGEEFGAQAFVVGSELAFVMLHGDVVERTAVATVPVGHYVPYPADHAVRAQVDDIVTRTIAAMGLDNCALNFDFMLRDGKVLVLEVGARSGATCLAEMVGGHYGIDYYAWMIDVALGRRPHWSPGGGRAVAAALLTAPASGIVQAVPPPPAGEDIFDYAFDFDIGQAVSQFRVGPDRIGHVVVTGDSIEAARTRLREVLAGLKCSIAMV